MPSAPASPAASSCQIITPDTHEGPWPKYSMGNKVLLVTPFPKETTECHSHQEISQLSARAGSDRAFLTHPSLSPAASLRPATLFTHPKQQILEENLLK